MWPMYCTFVFYSGLLRLQQALLRITVYETHCLNVVYMKPLDIAYLFFPVRNGSLTIFVLNSKLALFGRVGETEDNLMLSNFALLFLYHTLCIAK